MIKTCINKCNSAYQDKKYGKWKRVHKPTDTENKYRCVVCGTIQAIRPITTPETAMAMAFKKARKN